MLDGPANDKAHIPLTKCFALSDFGGAALAQRVQVPRPGERAGFIMINVTSDKPQAGASVKR